MNQEQKSDKEASEENDSKSPEKKQILSHLRGLIWE